MSEEKRPDLYPEWALNLVKDNISGQYNIYTPPQAKRNVGFTFKEKPWRQAFNWLFNTIYEWISWLDYTAPRTTAQVQALDATTRRGKMYLVTDLQGGICFVYSDGNNWVKLTRGGTL